MSKQVFHMIVSSYRKAR